MSSELHTALREHKERLGLSGRGLARLLGLSPSQTCGILRGRGIGKRSLEAIMQHLSVLGPEVTKYLRNGTSRGK